VVGWPAWGSSTGARDQNWPASRSTRT
jgi:hypothetical protein